MKGKKKGKTAGPSKQERKDAVRKKVQEAFSGEVKVEIIPATYDLEPEVPRVLRVAAYCRVSTDQASQTGSYELQVQYYENYIQNHPGWEYVGTFADEGISGTSDAKRKQFKEMIEACKEGRIDLIITKDIRRFARNTLDCLSYIRQLKKLDPPVGILFEDEHLNTLDRGIDAMLALLSSVAQGESENKSEAIKWSYKRRFAKGMTLAPTWALLGYDTDEKGNMFIVPDEADTVRFIYANYLDGVSVKEIAAMLTAAQVPTVKGLEVWPVGSVYNILRNEKYCGDVINQKTVTPDFLDHKVVKNRGQERKYIVRDHHPAIIERSDWDKVQAMLSDRSRRRGRTRKDKPIERLAITTIKRGRLKGFVVLDPHWSRKDWTKVLSALNIQSEEKEN